MAKQKSPSTITAETRSLENRARIVKLEHALLGGPQLHPNLRPLLTRKLDKFQDDVNQLAKLFEMHGGK